jgi:SpoVK/Ycf46/Vps4 family AAA+-type ATPase
LDPALVRRFDMNAYLRLPNKDQRKKLFQKIIGESALPRKDFDSLAYQSEGFSMTDVETAVAAAYNNAFVKDLNSDYFCLKTKTTYMACLPSTKGAIKTSPWHLPRDSLRGADIKFEDVKLQLRSHGGRTSMTTLARLESFYTAQASPKL